ncbi:MAG: TrmB family transcriptional regulator [Candidatus Helarchaeota archaeon]
MECDLTQNDAIIYLWLLKNQKANPSEIAKGTGIRRPRVYDSIKRLMARGFVVPQIEQKRPQYMAVDAQVIIQALENQIKAKQTAIKSIQQKIVNQIPAPTTKGIFFYNSNEALRMQIINFMQQSQKRIVVVGLINSPIWNDELFSSTLFKQKSAKGQEITLILNISSKNWEGCIDLFEKNVQILHYPYIKEFSIFIHLIDDRKLILSHYNLVKDKISLDYGFVFDEKTGFVKAFSFLIQGFIAQSRSLKERIKELEKSIIYPTEKLKKLFGIKE